MNPFAAIVAGSNAVNAGSGLIGSIANAVLAGQKLNLQRDALEAQIKFQENENKFNQNKFNFDSNLATQYLELARRQQEIVHDLNVNGPVQRATAMVRAGFRTGAISDGRQITFSDVQAANTSAAFRYYRPQIDSFGI